MNKIYLLIIVTFICQITGVKAQASYWQWAKKSTGSINYDGGTSIAVDADGNSYVTGYFQFPAITFDTVTLTSFNNSQDIFISKYDASGNVMWAKSFGGNWGEIPTGIAVDPNGNIYITGYFGSDSIIFGAFTVYNIVTTSAEVFTVKLDNSGNVLWAKNGVGTATDLSQALTADKYENCYVTGYFYGSSVTFGSITLSNAGNGVPDYFIVKYDPSGNVVWAKRAGGLNYDQGQGITTDSDGEIYVTGYYGGPSITFGSFTLNDMDEMFVVKYDTAGNVLWARKEGGGNYDIGIGIAVDANKNYFVAGDFYSPSITIGSTTLTNAGSTITSDFFIVKYNAAGIVQWVNGGGGTSYETTHQMTVDRFGNSYITGVFGSPTLTIDNITLTNANGAGNIEDIFLAKFSPSGNVVWARSLGGVNRESGLSIAVDTSNYLYLTGEFGSPTLVLDTITLNNSFPASDSSDFFIARLHLDPYCSAHFIVYPDTTPHNWIAVNQATGIPPMTYLWNWGDGNTSTGMTPSHTYNNPGYYNICLDITDAAGCSTNYCDSSTYLFKGPGNSAMVTINVIAPLGIFSPETDESIFNIYPNPATRYLTIALEENNKEVALTITDITGKIVYATTLLEVQNIVLNTENFSEGIYFVRIQTANSLVTKKFISTK